jgi:hypothetical protein
MKLIAERFYDVAEVHLIFTDSHYKADWSSNLALQKHPKLLSNVSHIVSITVSPCVPAGDRIHWASTREVVSLLA